MSVTDPPGTRLGSIDIDRGAVMVLMAIDHVRVYSGVPAGGPSLAIFFTRWVTHFCAPAFVFLAGTSAFLYGRVHPGLSRFLLARGAWLVLLELTLIRLAWTFILEHANDLLAGVIWVIGWSMILMAGLVRLPVAVVGALGLVIIAGHNAVGPSIVRSVTAAPDSTLGALGKIFYVSFFAGPVTLGASGLQLTVLYSIVPWVGVMAAGYAFGTIVTGEPRRRRRLCLAIGLSAVALFLVLRGLNLYGDPNPWNGGVLAFLNTTKYPASFSFLLMTLGPTIALLPLLDHARGPIGKWLTVFGRVPFFFYLLHIPLIHALALVVSKIRLGEVSPWLFANHPMGHSGVPDGYTWSLGLVYLVWAVAIAVLFFACRWYSELKARRRDLWMSYL
jgi:uncharacterized membrane protein